MILSLSLFGCKNGEDEKYGINPPASFLTLLQGPPIFINGETYTDYVWIINTDTKNDAIGPYFFVWINDDSLTDSKTFAGS